ncbi:MAG: LysR family transcriptional regulator [Eggerthellaceae bacterium]|jgi:LysR family transcriptional activator of glutamate synthase operon
MNLSQLYYFRKLAELQHYTRAAKELFISQPTLSHAISALEEDLGVKLFEKSGRNVQLTEAGQEFKEYVDAALGTLDEGIAAIKKRQGRLSGTVSFGAIATVHADFLPAAVLAYRRKRGSLIDLRITQAQTKDLMEGIRKGDLEFAIASEGHNTEEFTFTPLFSQQLVVAVTQGHPLANRSSVTMDDLRGREVFTYREGTAIGNAIDKFLDDLGYGPRDLQLNRDSDDEVMLGSIAANEPVAALVLLTSGLAPYPNLKIIPLDEPAAKDFYHIGILKLADARLSPVAQDLVEFLESFPVNQYTPNAKK